MTAPENALESVLVQSEPMPADSIVVEGYDFEAALRAGGVDYDELLGSFATTGFQATNFGLAVDRVNEMLNWRLSDDPIPAGESEDWTDPAVRAETKCKIFLGYTSNMASAGVRESIRFLVQNKLVDVVVSTAGGVEEDFIKCMHPTYIGDFALPGRELRLKGRNRIGNLIVPNENYCSFEEWIMPILDAMLDEHRADPENVVWTPSKLIHRLGKEINDERSIYYWCWKNDIPVYSPALTDGSIGDMLYFHSYRRGGLVLDIVGDIRAINSEAVFAKKTGMIIMGGGLIKHHICNANLMRNGADFAVFINTAQEFDGSDAGARPDEAVSWGKIRLDARPVKVYAEATMVFPLLVAQTFAKYELERRRSTVASTTGSRIVSNPTTNLMVCVRDEDRTSVLEAALVRVVLLRAFKGSEEANLVDALRTEITAPDGIALVAATNVSDNSSKIVGYIFFSPMQSLCANGPRTAGLAPLAVDPRFARRGVGSALVLEGIARCRAAGYDAVFVLGDATYYSRFGFKPASTFGNFKCEFGGEDAFQVLELAEGTLAKLEQVPADGIAFRYHRAFRSFA